MKRIIITAICIIFIAYSTKCIAQNDTIIIVKKDTAYYTLNWNRSIIDTNSYNFLVTSTFNPELSGGGLLQLIYTVTEYWDSGKEYNQNTYGLTQDFILNNVYTWQDNVVAPHKIDFAINIVWGGAYEMANFGYIFYVGENPPIVTTDIKNIQFDKILIKSRYVNYLGQPTLTCRPCLLVSEYNDGSQTIKQTFKK